MMYMPPIGTRVRFTCDRLGASKREDLGHTTGDVYGAKDTGLVVFVHPNARACWDWFYVEVGSKLVPGEKRYVGVTADMVQLAEQENQNGT